jgi:serine/threonine protein kinase
VPKQNWIGQTVGGRYQLESLLGQGGMSTVYKATDPNLKRTVAVKLIHPYLATDPIFVSRFEEEAEAVARLRHPNIVQVFDFSHEEDQYYMVLEYVPGQTLKRYLEQLGRQKQSFPIPVAINIAIRLCQAVDYAHRQGLIHRDLKPGNVMITPQGQVFLMDFGIAKIVGGDRHTKTGSIVGTAAYFSPEQINSKKIDHRIDIYALGVMLYEMVSGQLPFKGETTMEIIMKHLNQPVPDIRQFNREVPAGLVAVLEKALAKNPQDRYQSCAEMIQALNPLLAATQAGIPTKQAEPSHKGRRLLPLSLAVVILLLILLVCAGVLISGWMFGRESLISAVLPSSPTPLPSSTSGLIALADQPRTPTSTVTATALPYPTQMATLTSRPSPTPTRRRTNTPVPSPTLADTLPFTSTLSSESTPVNHTGVASQGDGLPLSFESFGLWTRGDESNGSFTPTSASAYSGASSAKLSYNFSTTSNDYVVFSQINDISGQPNSLQVWVDGDGSGHYLNAWIVDDDGQTWQVPFGQVQHTGWKLMTGLIAVDQKWPWTHISGADNGRVDYPIAFRGFVLDDYSNSYTGQGAIYLDDLSADTTDAPPVVSNPTPGNASPPPTTSVVTGDVGRILYTVDDTILTTDPAWTTPQQVGHAASDTCQGTASTVTGQSFNLYRGPYCGISQTISTCISPNGQYEVVVDIVSGTVANISIRANGESGSGTFIYQGEVDSSEGIRWSPLSTSFLFVVVDTVHQAFPGGGYNQIIPTANNPMFSPSGEHIMYLKPVGPGIRDVFVSDANGANQRNVTNTTSVDKQCPAWHF